MNEKNNIFEEEISLAPPMSLLEEATEVARSTMTDDKFSFFLHYDENQKDSLLAVVTASGAHIEADDSEACVLKVHMNMVQLELIKRLDCVIRVRTKDGSNTALENSATADVAVASYDVAVASANNGQAYGTKENARPISLDKLVNGNIVYAGAEQWFSFTAPETGTYTIYSEGGSDTVGILYDCCGCMIIGNTDYHPAGDINFRIIRELQANTKYYIRVTIEKDGIGEYKLGVTKNTLVTSVSITPQTIVLKKGVTYRLPIRPNVYVTASGGEHISDLEVKVEPSEATDKRLKWRSLDPNILRVFENQYNNQTYYMVEAVENGKATLEVCDWNDHGKVGQCTVDIISIELNYSSLTIRPDDIEYLTATVLPENALGENVVWGSTNINIVEVDQNGWIYAKAEGTAIITATNGSVSADCAVYVTNRLEVTIEKDNEGAYEFFKLTFPASEGGLVWQSVGYDLTRTDAGVPSAARNRANYNIPQEFSERQLALLYIFDPLGVEYYVKKYYLLHDDKLQEGVNAENAWWKESENYQKYKDRVYKEIFGVVPQRFLVNDNGIRYTPSASLSRYEVHTDAELVFGIHTIFDKENMVQFVIDLTVNLLGIALAKVDLEDWVKAWPSRCATVCSLLFMGGSIVDAFSSSASGALDSFIEKRMSEDIMNLLMWPTQVFDIITCIADGIADTFGVFDPNDYVIYNKIAQQQYYKVNFKGNSKSMFMEDILDYCE